MKTTNLLALLAIIFLSSNDLFATDRIVQQSGPVGTFSSISSAITAAVDGDNIIINNKTDGSAWFENLTINKSLTFISAVDNVQWYMSGNITCAQGEGRIISLVGMRNTLVGANITRTGTTPVNRMTVNILSSDIVPNINLTNVNLNLGSCKLAGTVTFSYGRVIGNEIAQTLTMSSDAMATEDVNFIVGNKITVSSGNGYYSNSTSQYLYFGNNYVRGSTSVFSAVVHVNAVKSGLIGNRISNCSIVCAYTGSTSNNALGLNVANSGGNVIVENTILAGSFVNASNGGNSVQVQASASSTTSFTYCMYYNPHVLGTTPPSANQNFSSSTAVPANFNTDGVFSGTANINMGNPINTQLDLNLTRNDIGAYGSSNSLENFLPVMTNPESSRVNFVTAPRVVSQGGVVNIQAFGFDK